MVNNYLQNIAYYLTANGYFCFRGEIVVNLIFLYQPQGSLYFYLHIL